MAFWFLLSFLISADASNVCSVSFDSSLMRPSDIRLMGGYNDVLGPAQNLTYNDEGLLLSSKMLYNGIMRHPGGTVANYWTFKNASYIQNCNVSECSCCNHQKTVNKLPPQTFSPGNFSKGIGISSPLINSDNEYTHSIVYVLNIYSLTQQQMIKDLDAISNEVGSTNVGYIELGNEYYLQRYQNEFPNATVYINKAMPAINKIRSTFPNAKISVTSNREHATNVHDKWNIQLNEFNNSFDSVTVHDYSLKQDLIGDLTPEQQISFVSIYGLSMLPQIIDYVRYQFGDNKTIWMTEYNINQNVEMSNNNYQYQVLHSMFAISYMSAAICDATKTMELLMIHEYASQNGNPWGIGDEFIILSALDNNSDGEMTFNINAQIMAQLNYYSQFKNNQVTCLKFNGDLCPTLNLNVVNKKNLQCVFGIGLNNNIDNNSFGFVIVNACKDVIQLELKLNTFINMNTISNNVQLEIYEYLYNMDGGINNKFSNCPNGANLWDKGCAAVYGNYTQSTISKNQTTLNLDINGLSLLLAATK